MNTTGLNINELLTQINYNCGAAPKEVLFNGDIERFDIDEKNDQAGWIYSCAWDFNGTMYALCKYGSWKKGITHIWRSYSKEDERTVPGLLKTIRDVQKSIEKEQELFAEEKKVEILEKYKTYKTLKSVSESSYLIKKGIEFTCKDLRKDYYNNLIVPIYSNTKKRMEGFQRILEKKKAFPTGQQVRGNFYFFGKPEKSEYVYLCEGFATGATIYEITGIPTFVAFQANNLPSVAERLKHELNGVKMIIAADNDSQKTSAGMYWAKRAQKQCSNIHIVCPRFQPGSSFTDFNDLYLSEGREETDIQLAFNDDRFIKVEFLGFDEGNYYFYSTKTNSLRHMTLDKIKRGHLIELAPEPYWAQRYVPVIDKSTLLPTQNCNWPETAKEIISDQNDIGPFLSHRIKGVGSWKEPKSGDHILNLGSKIYLNNEPFDFGKNNITQNFYMPSFKIQLEFEEKPSSNFCTLLEAVDLIDFKSDRDRILYLGFLAYAQVFTTQRWRPHIWVRADKGTGKSSLLSFTNQLISNSTMFQDSTSAGIRQSVGANSRVCLVDEAEGESYKTRQLVELARQSSSGSGTQIVRGTPEGRGFNFNPELCFFFASIRAAELTPADESRILQISMKKNGHKSTKELKELTNKLHDAEKLSTDLFSYMNINLEKFETVLKEIKSEIIEAGFDSRYADQKAPVIAGYYMLNPQADMTKVLLTACDDEIESSGVYTTASDQEAFYDVFISILLRMENEEKTLSEILLEYKVSSGERAAYLCKFLKRYGISYLKKRDQFFVASNNNLKNLAKRQTKFQDYFAQMKDNKFFEKYRLNSARGYVFSV